MRVILLLSAVVLGLFANCSNDKACGNNSRGFCGSGQWCEDLGASSRCRPIPALRSFCGKEQWPGECSAGTGNEEQSDAAADGQSAVADAQSPPDALGDARGSGGAGGNSDAPATPEVGGILGGAGGGGSAGSGGSGGIATTGDAGIDAADTGAAPFDSMPPMCTSSCEAGTTRCAAGIETCIKLPSGCTGWGPAKPCSEPQMCVAGGSKCECPPDSCQVGAERCGPGGGAQRCLKVGDCGKWGTEASCEPYGPCTSGGCKKACDADVECAAAFICEVHMCVAQCGAQSQGNLVANAGFDRSVDGWGPGAWDSSDSVGCRSSGSLTLNSQPSRGTAFAVAPGVQYYVGFQTKNIGVNTSSGCDLDWCASLTCGVVLRTDSIPAGKALAWSRTMAQFTAPAGAGAARFTCRTDGSTNFDRFYVSSSQAKF
jgi:hypothetical protein